MRKFLLSLFLLISAAGYAQKVNNCGFIIPPPLPFQQFQSVYEARDVIKRMLDSLAWRENFSVREQNGSNNAFATIIGGKRWIIYDNEFLERLDYMAKTKQASISVLAHEIGHHYYNHVVDGRGSTPPKEIQADYFSGVVMAKLGYTLGDAIAAMQSVASERASATHPAKSDRVSSITRGWNAANKYADSVRRSQGGNPGTGGQGGNVTPGGGNTGGNPGSGNNGGGQSSNDVNDGTWIHLWHYDDNPVTVYLSDDNKRFDRVDVEAGKPFIFKYEIYRYGWIRVPAGNGQYTSYRLDHGKDYLLTYSRKRKYYVVLEVP